jgi:ribosome-associated protein
MSDHTFPLGEDQEFIPLDKLLKIVRLVGSGGEAHMVIQEGMVSVNGEVELQKRKKLRKGDLVEFNEEKITID